MQVFDQLTVEHRHTLCLGLGITPHTDNSPGVFGFIGTVAVRLIGDVNLRWMNERLAIKADVAPLFAGESKRIEIAEIQMNSIENIEAR